MFIPVLYLSSSVCGYRSHPDVSLPLCDPIFCISRSTDLVQSIRPQVRRQLVQLLRPRLQIAARLFLKYGTNI